MHVARVAQSAFFCGAQQHIQALGGCVQAGIDQPVAAPQPGFLDPGAGDGHGATVAGLGLVGGLVMHLNAAHPGGQPRRGDQQPIAHRDPPGDDGAGQNQAGARHCEGAIDGHPKTTIHWRGDSGRTLCGDSGAEVLDPGAGVTGHRHDGRIGISGACQDLAHCLGRCLDACWVHSVDLGQDGGHAGDAGQAQDGKMLMRLRHWAIVGGHHEKRGIDRQHSGQHIGQEPFMPGDVDEPDGGAVRHDRVGETQVDGHAARFLVRQPIGVDSGQGADQGGLSVIHVACHGDDHGAVSR